MKKYYEIFTFGVLLLLSAGCKNKQERIITRQNVVIEHDIYDDFGVLFYKDLEDTIVRMTMYDDSTYRYMQIGDTFNLAMTAKKFKKEYNKCNTMFPEEVIIDPGFKLKQKNELIKDIPGVQARRDSLLKELEIHPLQIIASKAVRIRK